MSGPAVLADAPPQADENAEQTVIPSVQPQKAENAERNKWRATAAAKKRITLKNIQFALRKKLEVTVGQFSDKGAKEVNQDFYAVCLPEEPALTAKGIAMAVADGISTSTVSQFASETAVRSFLEDYYCTPEAWSAKKSAHRVLMATNAWLHAQTSSYCHDMDRGYVCTFSALVIKSATAYLFHVGDARVFRQTGDETPEQLTQDHRYWVSAGESYLSNALGIDEQVEIDYRALSIEPGDVFFMLTDGVYEHVSDDLLATCVHNHPDHLEEAARAIVQEARLRGSRDNLTTQIVRIDRLPELNFHELQREAGNLPFPPELRPRMRFEGYEIARALHRSSRSHVFLARELATNTPVAIKVPGSDIKADPVLMERFLMEEWIARRIDSPHVVKAFVPTRQRRSLYVVMEVVEGQSLKQWLIDNPRPSLESARNIIEQIGKGLRAFHRQEMVHQDLRPDNVLIASSGTVKITDFGATNVPGIMEARAVADDSGILGTEQYAAPEYFLGQTGTPRSDIFSLGVIAYQMFTGTLPYGTEVPRAKSKAAQRKLKYRSVISYNRDVPSWVDGAIRKAVHPQPEKRYEDVSEFLFDLRYPQEEFASEAPLPLMERNPEAFWKGVSLLLALLLVLVLMILGR